MIAEADDAVVGVALCRLFTDDDHGHGYVDDATPEIAVAVAESRRRRGLATRLLEELIDAARAAGFARLSLSVDERNPSALLAQKLGYRELSRDEGGIRMVREIA